ncbi:MULTISPECIES: 4-hydroxybenzoate octaprenyltransferase [Pseudoalteromonas]|uniref:4-hydroxybenzoate octaprenyltransferase n=1 Tax=Pseudoalteromonas nigrifaciens TaxID=28109 RepID=A0AAC9XXZ0_9GAMM|nr:MULTISPECIES: 4-hydroxybenzoate octaprenyltransferase [Pseudoalteromonas]ASM54946.1 4-hydroxybenzoate octaprenyltransferase [Pseudoalteromonas nigrifaciens]MBB1371094.1 4-hydroxybenzoate octaprenyltransferase [Pseudoalteromonas sp. SR45-4]MBB1406780.1 4-hydroxybenzoate octaprenyltransferase [Pseudoalteromonas sp. SG44-5]MBH0072872.1 4-hydroxybenzoate octaprenyltransferase [Pseudoalteromonas sp. NZS127]MBH0094020.1 4-hydroxybenzoate octaprenyltransferase [Pseudoalteromonas sp. SCQQ13]|tara:strand:- start:63199 stop:64077 length:879 start_codon:yes stop_codon:yes gene_type:complete
MKLARLTPSHIPYYIALMRIDKPIGTLLLLWPTYWALWLANAGMPSLTNFIVFTLGVVIMRSAGCVINDFADRKIDGSVKRTMQRPLVSGQVSSGEAISLFILLITVAFLLVLMLSVNTILLSFGALALAFCYPFMKRYTQLPQVVLGAAFGWAIPMAFMASINALPIQAWLLFIANICWTVAYDTMYAMVDRDDDLKIGVKSTAILFGKYDRHIIGLLNLAFIALMLAIGALNNIGLSYWLGLSVAIVLLVYQQVLIQQRARTDCFKAFLNNHYVGLAFFIGLLFSYPVAF